MANTSPTKLFVFFVFFASVRILDNLASISAIVDHKIPRNSSSGTGADPCQKGPWKYVNAEVGRVEGNCVESDMASFANAVTSTRNAGKIGFFAEALLRKLDLNTPPSIDECKSKGDGEMVLEDYHRGLDLLLEVLDQRGIFEERDFCASVSEEDEHDNDDNVDDNVDVDVDDLSDDDDDVDDLSDDDGSDQDIEANFFD